MCGRTEEKLMCINEQVSPEYEVQIVCGVEWARLLNTGQV